MRIRNTAVALAYGQLVAIAIQLVQIPIFLLYWNKLLYGEWLVLTGLASTLVLLDFGVTKASESKAIQAINEGDIALTTRVMHTAQAYVLFAIAVLLIAIASVCCIDIPSVLGLLQIEYQECVVIIVSLFINVAVSLQLGMVDAGFKVADVNARGQFILANRRVVNLFVTTIALSVAARPGALAICLAVFDVLYLLAAMIYLVSVVKFSIFGIRRSSKSEFKHVFRPAMGYVAFPLSQAITIQGSTQLLFQFTDASVVVSFTLVRTLVRTLAQIGLVFNNAMKPEVSRLAGQNKYDEALRIARKLSIVSTFTALGGYLSVIAIGPTIIRVWSRGEVEVDAIFVAMMGVHAVLYTLWIVPASLRMGLNQHTNVGFAYFSAACFIVAAWLTFPMFSPSVWAAMLLGFPELVACLALVMTRRQFEKRVADLMRDAAIKIDSSTVACANRF